VKKRMKRILFSILTVVAVAGLVGGATYAVFSNKATSGPNTFATGNADLKIDIDKNKNGVRDEDWQDDVDGISWSDLYPGWEDSYWIYLKNESSAPIDLRVRPEVTITSESYWEMKDKIKMEIDWRSGGHSSGSWPLRDWTSVDNNPYLDPILAPGQEAGPWLVKFSIPTTAGNEIADQTINFDLIFNGIQVTP